MASFPAQTANIFRRYRWRELLLLFIPFAILLLEAIQLLLVKQLKTDPAASFSFRTLLTVQALLPMIGLIAALLITNIILSIFFRKADQLVLPLVGLLSGIGVLMATRLGPTLPGLLADPNLGLKQLTWALLGLFVCIVTLASLRDINWLSRFKYILAALGIILVAITIAKALRVNLDSPTHDQLNFGPFNLQPSELLKIFIVIFFSAYLTSTANIDLFALGRPIMGPFYIRPLYLGRLRLLPQMRIPQLRMPSLPILGPLLLMLLVSLLLFLVVRELGLALLIYSLFLCIVYLASQRISYVFIGLLLFIVFSIIGYMLFNYVRQRFAVLSINVVTPGAFDENLYQKSAFQIVQGLIALSSGGILGAGLGLGHPGFVPVVQSDFILTALGEELGLAGLFAIIGIYLLLIYRGFRIAIEALDPFSQLLAAGLTSIFAIQTIIIAAGNMKLFPLTGIPLPFLSYGGSSILANYIIIGILLRISHNTAKAQQTIP
jgi:cell division protein FtsW (lipid II flippase)